MSIHPESRGFAYLVRATVDGVRDADFAIIGGAGAPSGGRTPTGQALAATQNALYCRSDGTDYDEGLYLTLDGGTTWKPAMFIGGSFTIEDSEALKFGTPGTDIVFTADGTDVVVTGTGDLVIADAVSLAIGTGKDLDIVSDGTDVTMTGTGAITITDSTGTVSIGVGVAGAVNISDGTASLTMDASGAVSLGDGTGSIEIDGAGALSLTGVTTIDLDGSGAVSLESSADAINVGADAVAQPLNLGTGAAARQINVGNAASAGIAMEAGVGSLTMAADVDIQSSARMTTTDGVASGTARVVGGRAGVNPAASTAVDDTKAIFSTGEYQIPAGTLKTNCTLKFKAMVGVTAVSGAGATLLLEAFFGGTGGTLIADSTAMPIGGAAGNGVNGIAIVEGFLTVRADASAGAGTVTGYMTSKFATVGAAYTVDTLDVAGSAAGTYTVAVDNSGIVAFGLAAQTDAAGTTVVLQNFEVEVVG